MTDPDLPARCPACSSADLELLYEQESIPVNSCLLLEGEQEAREFPRGDMRLAICHGCGFATNLAFDQANAEYSDRYEETQGFSPRFRAFARALAQRWIDRYDIRGRRVLEIGCGKGEFLALICELGQNTGIGVDPSAIPERLETSADVTLLPERLGPQHADLAPDVIVCRHTLEHIGDVRGFMRLVRQIVGDREDTVVLFELPDVLRVLREVAIWDVYYEHCSYFTTGSLARLFRDSGFDVLNLELDFDDQYILLEARPRPAGRAPAPALALEDDLGTVLEAAADFARRHGEVLQGWRAALHEESRSGSRCVIWGGGSKGVAYLTTIDTGGDVRYVVDINPHKHGKYMAGTGQLVVAPEFLKDYRPDVVVAMNAVYTEEIGADLDRLGVQTTLRAV